MILLRIVIINFGLSYVWNNHPMTQSASVQFSSFPSYDAALYKQFTHTFINTYLTTPQVILSILKYNFQTAFKLGLDMSKNSISASSFISRITIFQDLRIYRLKFKYLAYLIPGILSGQSNGSLSALSIGSGNRNQEQWINFSQKIQLPKVLTFVGGFILQNSQFYSIGCSGDVRNSSGFFLRKFNSGNSLSYSIKVFYLAFSLVNFSSQSKTYLLFQTFSSSSSDGEFTVTQQPVTIPIGTYVGNQLSLFYGVSNFKFYNQEKLKLTLQLDSSIWEIKYGSYDTSYLNQIDIAYLLFQTRICNPPDQYLDTDLITCLSACPSGYSPDNQNLCAQCHVKCQQCNGFLQTQCTDCTSSRNLVVNQCQCKEGYYESNNKQCQICHYSCKSCSSYQSNKCLTCFSDRSFQTFQCLCLTVGTYDNKTQICANCHYSCKSCDIKDINCTSCQTSQHRELTNHDCLCQIGYFQIGTDCDKCSYSCHKCQTVDTYCIECDQSMHRTFDNWKCLCQIGYFDNSISQCSKCDYSCKECSSNSAHCTSCLSINNRYIDNNNCICNQGYFDNSIPICQLCHYSCKTCSSINNCTMCQDLHFRNKTDQECPCIEKYFDKGVSQCSQCYYSCNQCQTQFSNCISCNHDLNRQLQLNKCQCIKGYFEKAQERCYQCKISCGQCSNQSTCTRCYQDQFRIKLDTDCICLPGYLQLSQYSCKKCHYSCQTCEILPTNCTSCNSQNKRKLKQNTCICFNDFYDSFSQSLCYPACQNYLKQNQDYYQRYQTFLQSISTLIMVLSPILFIIGKYQQITEIVIPIQLIYFSFLKQRNEHVLYKSIKSYSIFTGLLYQIQGSFFQKSIHLIIVLLLMFVIGITLKILKYNQHKLGQYQDELFSKLGVLSQITLIPFLYFSLEHFSFMEFDITGIGNMIAVIMVVPFCLYFGMVRYILVGQQFKRLYNQFLVVIGLTHILIIYLINSNIKIIFGVGPMIANIFYITNYWPFKYPTYNIKLTVNSFLLYLILMIQLSFNPTKIGQCKLLNEILTIMSIFFVMDGVFMLGLGVQFLIREQQQKQDSIKINQTIDDIAVCSIEHMIQQQINQSEDDGVLELGIASKRMKRSNKIRVI